MKKHILGLAIFSFIVFAAAFIGGLFAFSKIDEVSMPQNLPIEKTHSDLNYDSIEIKQAVFNINTKKLNFEFSAPSRDEAIELQFFSKDDRGTRYIAAEQVQNKLSGKGVLRFVNSYERLNKRSKFENLYVIARFDSDSIKASENVWAGGNTFEPKFDSTKAVPVTIDYGR